MNRIPRILGAALLTGVAATAAVAGGPNYIFDKPNEIPYVWKMATFGGPIPVYTDLGNLKNANPLIDNATANSWAVQAWDQWNSVPTSTFRAHVVGDVSLLGFPDITISNVAQVFPVFNGGGVMVVYDATGQIFSNYLGFAGVLGLSFHEWYANTGNEILEETTFINGTGVASTDSAAIGRFKGVFTHEFGHAVNLRHSQANGAVLNVAQQEPPFPFGCTNQPYPGGPASGPTPSQIETMYPFLDVSANPTSTGLGQFTVDRMDDISAISDLYPAAGWPGNYGTIKGTLRFLTKINGSGTGPTEEISGVNLIARNLADPYNDFNSTTSGELTRGEVGPDGSFEMHGLTPGATYGLYVDRFVVGGFPTAPLISMPGPEEWYNGANESGNGETDDRCAWTGIPVTAGTSSTADITFNRIKGAPSYTRLDFIGEPTNITADGSVMVGVSTAMTGYWTWSEAEGFEDIGGFAQAGGTPWISDDGTKVAGNFDLAGNLLWAIADRPTHTWTILAPPDPNSWCSVSGPYGNRHNYGLVFGSSGDGSTIVGNSYNSGPNNCSARPTSWNAVTGAQFLPDLAQNGNQIDRARPNKANVDGSILVGYDNATFPGSTSTCRAGAYWDSAGVHALGSTCLGTADFVTEALFVTRDGTWILGNGSSSPGFPRGPYRYNRLTGVIEYLTIAPPGPVYSAFRSNDAANVIGGIQPSGFSFFGTIWTPEVGWMNLTSFLEAQGTYASGATWSNIKSMSADGTIWALYQSASGGFRPVIIDIPKAIVCHVSPDNPNGKRKNLDVTFPSGLDTHLGHGDTLGLCPQGGD